MSMRAVDIQMLMFRLQDVQQAQPAGQTQPNAAQAQFAQAFSQKVDEEKEKVLPEDKTQGQIIRGDEKGKGGGGQRQQQRRKNPAPQPELNKAKETKPPVFPGESGGRIDVRV